MKCFAVFLVLAVLCILVQASLAKEHRTTKFHSTLRQTKRHANAETAAQGHKNHGKEELIKSKQELKHYNFKHEVGKTAHDSENAKKGHGGFLISNKKHAEKAGKKSEYHDEDSTSGQHHVSNSGKHGTAYKHGKADKGRSLTKAYHSQYHKDEHKKHDSFFSKGEKSGDFHRFGAGHSKFQLKHLNKSSGGKHKLSKDADKYGKNGKSGKHHDKSNHKAHKGESGKESKYNKETKWSKNYRNHDRHH